MPSLSLAYNRGVMVVVDQQSSLRLVGKRMRRADSPERLTGAVRYTGDLVLPGLLYGRLVRSPYASARIVSIDKKEALATPGVFAEAEGVVEREFRAPWVPQSYMEPQVCAATVDPLGSVVVYACPQAMFRTRDTVANVLGKSPSQVRVYAMPVGGGFGGKFGLIEPLVAACAVATGRAVRLAFTRNEDFSAAGPAPSSIFRVKMAALKDGTFTALKAEVFFDAGAKAGAPAAHAALCLAV